MNTLKSNANNELNSRFFYVIYVLFLLFLIVIFDVLVGIVIIDEHGNIMDYPVPPYGAVITAEQEQRFEQLSDDQDDKYIVFDEHLGWTIGSNRRSRDGMYESNSHGIRATREYTYEVPEGKRRMAVFGDSYTECVDVSDEQAWPYLLEQNFEDLEVLNFGVRAYGTDQAFLRYRRDGKKFNPDIVIIGFLLENIRRNVNRYRPAYEHNTGGLGVKPRFLYSDNQLVLLPNPVSSREELKELIAKGTLFETVGSHDYWYQKFKFAINPNHPLFRSNILRLLWLIYEKYERDLQKLYSERHEEPFLVTSQLIKLFYEESLQNGAIKALVVIFPAQTELQFYIDEGYKFWHPLLEYFEHNRIEYLDLTAKLAAAHRKRPIVYGHYIPEGNQLVSESLSDWYAHFLRRSERKSTTFHR